MSSVMDIDNSISTTAFTYSTEPISLNLCSCQNLGETIRHILYHNKLGTSNATMNVEQEDVFEIIEKLRENPPTMFRYLWKHFAKHFDIDLKIIAFTNGQYSLLSTDDYKKKHLAFISFDENNKVSGCLYNVSLNGTRETVFPVTNVDVRLESCMYVTSLNHQKLSIQIPQVQEQHDEQLVRELIEHSTTTDQINPPTTDQVDEKHQSRVLLDQALIKLLHTMSELPVHPTTMIQILQPFYNEAIDLENLTSQEAIRASKSGIEALWKMICSAEKSLNISQNNSAGEGAGDLPTINETPSLKRPLQDHHPRNLGEFAANGKCPVKHVDSGQRDELEIEVLSSTDDNIELHLGMEFVDGQDSPHPLKLIVPDKAKVGNEALMNTNDLACFDFTGCDQDMDFDRETKQLYSKITPTERQQRLKKIRAHAVNLYQRGEVKERLKKCPDRKAFKLSLWYAVRRNNKYVRVSPKYYPDAVARETTQGCQTQRAKPTVKSKENATLNKTIKKR